MSSAQKLQREIPFSLAVQAREAYSDWNGSDETIFVQGIIDCLFEDEKGLVLVDYKTDGITDRFKGGFEEAKPILESGTRFKLICIQKQWNKFINGLLWKDIYFSSTVPIF